MRWRIGASTIGGATTVPGDKSIGHRALMLAGLASGTSRILNLPSGEDVLSTAACMRRLGVKISLDGTAASAVGRGRLSAPSEELDTGNSGTTMRLLSGILAGQSFDSRLNGDASLRRRPMKRVVEPLSAMGASIATEDGHAPLDIAGKPLHGIRYRLPVPSAQVKSAILLAGLFATGTTSVEEVIPSRDHTERMLSALGVPVHRNGRGVAVERGAAPQAFELTVPGDFSSAAFLFAAALLTGGEVAVEGVGLNPTRSALLDVLARAGARIAVDEEVEEAGEPRGRATVSGAIEAPLRIGPEDVPGVVDELPLLALLATQAPGESVIAGAAELRVKETDRIAAVASELRALGAEIEERPDGWRIRGRTKLHGAAVRGHGDHRIAMMLAVAGACARGTTVVDGAEVAAVSFPNFPDVFTALGARLETE